MRIFASLIFVLCLSVMAVAQLVPQEISIHQHKYYFMSNEVRKGELVEMLLPYDAPSAYMYKATNNKNVALGIQVVGLGVMAYPFYQAMSGGVNRRWYLIGAGAGICALSIPFVKAYHKNVATAVNLYNDIIKPKKKTSSLNLRIAPTSYGATILLSL